MIRTLRVLSLLLAVGFIAPQASFGAEDELAKDEAALEEPAKNPKFADEVKAKYNLTDDQMKSMQDKGLHGPQLAMTAQLAASSGKPLDDVIKMRTEQKMGWGKIAKELGVAPREIGQSVASLHHGAKVEEHMEAKEARKEAHEQKKAERKEHRNERKMNRKGKG